VCPTCQPGGGEVHLVDADELARTPQGARYLLGRVLSGRFRVEGYLGGGGMGAVYRARQLAVDREVALKAIRTDFLTDPGSRKRFHQEARVVAQLGHPHIAQLYDFGADRLDQHSEPVHYMVMELVDGGSLKDLLEAKGCLSPERVSSIVRCMLLGLASAHAKGVVHRDLKPANILFDRRSGLAEHVKIVDFGLAKLLEGQEKDLTGSGTAFGTPEYMAPEQWRGEPVDGRTDLYALGCIVFEMLTGRPPFVGPTPLSLASQHMDVERPALTHEDGQPLGPEALTLALQACLALEPEDRLPRADDVLELLDRLELRNPSGPRYTPRPTSRPMPPEVALQQPTSAPLGEEPAGDEHRHLTPRTGAETIPWRPPDQRPPVYPRPEEVGALGGESAAAAAELLTFSLDDVELPSGSEPALAAAGLGRPAPTPAAPVVETGGPGVLVFEADGVPERPGWQRSPSDSVLPTSAGSVPDTDEGAQARPALQVGRVRTRKASPAELAAESFPVGPANSSWPNAPVKLRSPSRPRQSAVGAGGRSHRAAPRGGRRGARSTVAWDRWLLGIALVAAVVALSIGVSRWWSRLDQQPSSLSFVPDQDGGPAVVPPPVDRSRLGRWQRAGGVSPSRSDGGAARPSDSDGGHALPPRVDGAVSAEPHAAGSPSPLPPGPSATEPAPRGDAARPAGDGGRRPDAAPQPSAVRVMPQPPAATAPQPPAATAPQPPAAATPAAPDGPSAPAPAAPAPPSTEAGPSGG